MTTRGDRIPSTALRLCRSLGECRRDRNDSLPRSQRGPCLSMLPARSQVIFVCFAPVDILRILALCRTQGTINGSAPYASAALTAHLIQQFDRGILVLFPEIFRQIKIGSTSICRFLKNALLHDPYSFNPFFFCKADTATGYVQIISTFRFKSRALEICSSCFFF